MLRFDLGAAGKVCYGAGDADYAEVGAHGQAEFFHQACENVLALRAQGTEAFDEFVCHFCIGEDGGLRINGCLVVLKDPSLKLEICDEAHKSRYTVHPGSTKMYKDLKRNFWWKGMKRYVAEYVS